MDKLNSPPENENLNNNTLLTNLNEQINKMAQQMEKTKLSEYVDLVNSPWRLLWINFISGVSRGIGIMMGFAVFGALLVLILNKLIPLNIPIIGEFIAEIVKIVQARLQ